MMYRDAKCAFADLTRQKCGVRPTVEPVAAQVVGHGLQDLGYSWPDKANRPMDLHPGTSSPLPYNQISFVNLMLVPVGWHTVHRFRQHKRVPDARAFSGP